MNPVILSKYTSVILGLMVAWASALVVSQTLTPATQVPLPILNVPEVQVSISTQPTLQAVTLFGQKPVQAMPEPKVLPQPELTPDSIEVTRLNLRLIGLIKNPTRSIAMIEQGGNTLVLAEGESVSSQVKVERIERQYVVLNNRGKFESLYLQGVDPKNMGSVASATSAMLSQADKAKLTDIQQGLRTAPLSINRYVRFKTMTRNGQVVGLQVWPRRERKVFEALGFQAGDQVLAVNGQEVATLIKSPKSWQTLLTATQFELQILRKGQSQTLSVSLDN